ncbi:hypothetical protein QQM39_00015 [Streptomyces sp. DT2A-34]|uniref:hypothetical protein n=1 Tax=Streptomyces sp. DT2A-34 TaxID=3051182 RepID=UPI00265C809A|nr:hypothetical protein [Streptomyces sp. DT2A-34]MDO0909316.1 hypothetical protein [Streptomyces sp. DT2A-34]
MAFEATDHTLRKLARCWETFRQKDDPKKSPAVAVIEDVLCEGRQARIHIVYDGPAIAGGLAPAPASSSPRSSSPGPAPASGSGSSR